MAFTREQKKKIIEKLKENIDKQKVVLFVVIAGLQAKDLLDLRNKLKEKDCLLTVAKKTLLRIVFQEKNVPIDIKKLEGEIALIFGFGDELSAAKITNQFSLGNENLKILGGFFENKFIDKEKVVALATIPSLEELLARVAGSIKTPISNFINVLQGNIKGLIYLLSSIKK